jgi:hypothetical protein
MLLVTSLQNSSAGAKINAFRWGPFLIKVPTSFEMILTQSFSIHTLPVKPLV